ncbi:MAG: cbb3-type cytochrome c oxidase subunit I [Nevskia sp.]|nr:cbb3-type cytochrome c oxidase subunit I [Nevskia sp.]
MDQHAPASFWRQYVFSTDHKVIGLQYMITGLMMALIGGWLAYVFRTQLAWPGIHVPGFGVVTPPVYNSLVTMHGTIMIFWVGMPVLIAGFGNYLIPLMVGTDDMAFPRLNMLSYWIFFLSTVVILASFVVPGGASAAGWTAYPPLSSSFSGVQLGMTLWILGVALEFAAFLLGGINMITTAINHRAPGMKMFDLPILVWEMIAASIVFMLSAGPLIAGAVMLLLDQTAGTGFFSPNKGGDPLLYQHLFWFFGHPEVYVLLLPALGILGEVLTCHARKTLFGYKMIVYSTIAVGLLSFVVWAHHQFISGINPKLAFPFSLTTMLISVPVAVSIFSFIATLWQGSIRFTTAMLFALGMLATFLLGGVTGIALGSAATDVYLHDTYYVIAHFHYTMFPLVFLASFAGIYHWYPKMFGRMLNEPLGVIHWAGTIVCFNAIFLPLFNLGLMGHQRRVPDPTVFENLRSGMHFHHDATWATFGLLLFQLPFIFNFFYSMFRGPAAAANPWQATTLEWDTPSPPPHGNFLQPPSVYRGPYVYSPPDRDADWIPQHEPPAPPDEMPAAKQSELSVR